MTKTWRDVFNWCLIASNSTLALFIMVGLYRNQLDAGDRFVLAWICLVFFYNAIWRLFIEWACRNYESVRWMIFKRQFESRMRELEALKNSFKR